MPKLDEGQVVKMVATKGGQTFTALFNSRGQAIGADTPTTATYQLQQGTAISITIRLRLTAGTTAATQAFEGALKLTFQLPEGTSAERRSAVLEAARKAAQEVEAALANKAEVAARLVSAVNGAGAVGQVENFRTAVTNLGVFDSLFRAVQAELLAVSAQKLEVRKDLAPIDGSEFPLDQVVISPSGLLGFSGQRNPITMGGAVTSNFVPTPARGGGSGGTTTRLPALTLLRALPSVDRDAPEIPDGGWVDGLAFLRGVTPRTLLAVRDVGLGRFTLLDIAAADIAATTATTLGLPSNQLYGVAQTQDDASKTVFFSAGASPSLFWYESEKTPATGVLVPTLQGSGQARALGAGRTHVYVALPGPPAAVWAYSQDGNASYPVQVNSANWEIDTPTALAVHHPAGVASATLFVGNNTGAVFMAEDGGSASRTLAGFGSPISGMAFATPTLYVSVTYENKVYALNVTQDPVTSYVIAAASEPASATLSGFSLPTAPALELDPVSSEPVNLFIGSGGPPMRVFQLNFGRL